ncbi:MAG: hypothetical protein KDA37_14035 [Planctomycetales bacterium]|nr:hypothetical protein [Planctomycetales bacterium]
MASFVKTRRVRCVILVLYGLIAGMDQGLHVLADAQECRAAHCHDSGCACCGLDSPFAQYRQTQLARLGPGAHFEQAGQHSHDCQSCIICQTLAQMVAKSSAPTPLPLMAQHSCALLLAEERQACASQTRLPEGRGPPVDVA